MKSIILSLLFLPLSVLSQKSFETKKEALTAIRNGSYTSSVGWIISNGDMIQLSRGSMPDKTFAFIFQIPNVFDYNSNVQFDKIKLPHRFNGRKAQVKEVLVLGNKRSGFYMAAKIMVGEVNRYVLDSENALYAKELLIPDQYASKLPSEESRPPSSPASIGDELKKLKELFDSGAITQEEYTAAKKKFIEQ